MKNRLFPPRPKAPFQVIQREENRGRIEIRSLEVLEVTPAQVGFPGARLAARLITRVERQDGRWTEKIVYLISSLNSDQLQAREMLRLKRGYWVIESRLHHCLDVTMHEDLSRVRNPNSARVLGLIRRVVLSLAHAALDRLRQSKPKVKANIKTFRQRYLSARGGAERLRALIFAKTPAVLTLPT